MHNPLKWLKIFQFKYFKTIFIELITVSPFKNCKTNPDFYVFFNEIEIMEISSRGRPLFS